jgi:hypothetical protein
MLAHMGHSQWRISKLYRQWGLGLNYVITGEGGAADFSGENTE